MNVIEQVNFELAYFESADKHLVLYNCGRIFFILSFFVGYILSFGLVRLITFRLRARIGAHIEQRCSRSRGEDVTITDVIIKTPARKCLGMWMTSSLEAMVWDSWVFLKKTVSWDLRLNEASWNSNLGEASPVVCWGMSTLLWGQWVEIWTYMSPVGQGGAPHVVGSDGTVSIVKIMYLSLLVLKT